MRITHNTDIFPFKFIVSIRTKYDNVFRDLSDTHLINVTQLLFVFVNWNLISRNTSLNIFSSKDSGQ